MKALVFITALGAVLFSLYADATQYVTVYYQGEFVSGTCDVGVNDGSENGTVTLPEVTADELNENKTAGKTTFYFSLKNCSWVSSKTVSVYFEGGSTVDTTNYYLKNSGGSATGVELVLKAADDNQIKPGTETQAGGDTLTSGNNVTNDFSVSYITNDIIGPASGGTVTSYITYHLEYK